jgi:DNA polymerase-4
VRLDDWTTITRARSMPEPTCAYETVAGVALALLQENAPQRPVRLLGVRVAGLVHGEPEPHPAQSDGVPQMALPV